jgi:hypothetical protein
VSSKLTLEKEKERRNSKKIIKNYSGQKYESILNRITRTIKLNGIEEICSPSLQEAFLHFLFILRIATKDAEKRTEYTPELYMQYVHGINHNVAESPQGSTRKERRGEKCEVE